MKSAGMIPCTECQAKSKVMETRRNVSGVHRRYVCINNHRFSTQETPTTPRKPVPKPEVVQLPPAAVGQPRPSVLPKTKLVPECMRSSRPGSDDNLKIKSRGFDGNN